MALNWSAPLSVICLTLSACVGGESHAVVAPTAPATSLAQTPAQRIFLDPVTGEQRAPTPEELQQLRLTPATLPAKSAEAPRVVEYPNGAVGVIVNRPKNQVHVEEMQDGSLRTYCKDGASGRKAKP
jgi:hypothetical protein